MICDFILTRFLFSPKGFFFAVVFQDIFPSELEIMRLFFQLLCALRFLKFKKFELNEFDRQVEPWAKEEEKKKGRGKGEGREKKKKRRKKWNNSKTKVS